MGISKHRRVVRNRVGVVACCVVALVLVGCERGEVSGTSQVTDISATMHGTVHSDDPLPRYWFEYDPAPKVVDGQLTFASKTAVGQRGCCGPMLAASGTATGLTPDTEYYYRFCIRTDRETGMCGAPGTFRTKPDNRDKVEGSIGIPVFPQLGAYDSVSANVRAEPDGSDPVGTASRLPGSSYFRYPDSGSVTCLRVVGNRAAVGFVAVDDLGSGAGPFPQVIFVEDNGPGGDRFTHILTEDTPEDCPDPTDPSLIWKTSTIGNLTVTDGTP
jgi:hypothetical protein